jgi:flagellar protein FliO/FliZ
MRLCTMAALLAAGAIAAAAAAAASAETTAAGAAAVVSAPAPIASAPLAGVPGGVASAPAAIAPRPSPIAVAPMATGPMAGSSASSLLQTILALSAVLGLLAGFAWFMKRYGPKPAAGAANVRVVGALNLGGRERIMVIEVGDQWIVVGAAPGRVNALATMPKQEGAAAAAAVLSNSPNSSNSADSKAAPAAAFGHWLKQTIEKRNAK